MARKKESYTRLPSAPRPLQLGALAFNTLPNVGVQLPPSSTYRAVQPSPQGAYAVATDVGERAFNYNCNTHDQYRTMAALVHPASALPTVSLSSSSMSSSRLMSSSMSSRSPPWNAGAGIGPCSLSSLHSFPRLQGLQTIRNHQSLQTLHQPCRSPAQPRPRRHSISHRRRRRAARRVLTLMGWRT
jgi:hypothetical protein